MRMVIVKFKLVLCDCCYLWWDFSWLMGGSGQCPVSAAWLATGPHCACAVLWLRRRGRGGCRGRAHWAVSQCSEVPGCRHCSEVRSEDTAVSAAVTTWHIPSNAARQLTPKSEQCISSDICCNTASHVWHGVEASQVTFVYTVQLTCNAVCICHGDLLLLSDASQSERVEWAPDTRGLSKSLGHHLTRDMCPSMVTHASCISLSPGPTPHHKCITRHPGCDMRGGCKHENIPGQCISSCECIRDYKSLQLIRYSFPNDQKPNLLRLETNSIIVRIMEGTSHHYCGSCKKGSQ